MGRGHVCGDEPAGGISASSREVPGTNGGNGPSWTVDLTRGPPLPGATAEDPSLSLTSIGPILSRRRQVVQYHAQQCDVQWGQQFDPDYFIDGRAISVPKTVSGPIKDHGGTNICTVRTNLDGKSTLYPTCSSA